MNYIQTDETCSHVGKNLNIVNYTSEKLIKLEIRTINQIFRTFHMCKILWSSIDVRSIDQVFINSSRSCITEAFTLIPTLLERESQKLSIKSHRYSGVNHGSFQFKDSATQARLKQFQ